MMKALIIGGTGRISTSVCAKMLEQGWDLTLLNRGKQANRIPESKHLSQFTADISDTETVRDWLKDKTFDVIANFIVFTPEEAKRDIRLFQDRCGQYIFISSASAYQKPPVDSVITESTPLINPFWTYSQQKIACEEVYMQACRQTGFPVTIVRPSHTYDEMAIPLAIHGSHGSWQTIKRMLEGKPVVIHGDGTSLWTVTHSRDLAVAFAGLAGNPHAIGQAYHITSDEALSWNQIYKIVGQAFAAKPRIVHVTSSELIAHKPQLKGPLLGDKAHCAVFNNNKIKQLVPEFKALIRFDEGVRLSAEYYLAHQELRKSDPDWDAFLEYMTKDKPVSHLSDY